MAIFRNRLPPARDIALVFAACAFPVHLWTILRMLAEVPAWRLRLSLAELVGAAAHTLAFALLESLTLLVVIVLLGALLPARILRDRFVAKSSVLVLLTFAAAITAHMGVIQPWRMDPNLTVAVVLYAASVALSLYVVGHYPYVDRLISTTIEHLMVPSFLYIGLDVVGVLIVIYRNVVRAS